MVDACDRNEQIESEIGKSIEAHGKTIQKKSLESLDLAQELAQNGSTELFAESVQAHIEAIKSHVEATKEFQHRLQAHVDQIE